MERFRAAKMVWLVEKTRDDAFLFIRDIHEKQF
jgi:hypothetical protein